jgi:hypothetical protein
MQLKVITGVVAALALAGSAQAQEPGRCSNKSDKDGCPAPAAPAAKPAKPAKPGKPAGAPAAPNGKAAQAPGHDKVWICHATGSATNPYVLIHVPPPAVRAHERHQDGRDIVPAPVTDGKPSCPGADGKPVVATKAQLAAPRKDGKGKAWICHATGSATNPYVLLNVPTPAVAAHQRHQDGRDLVPAPVDAAGKPACPDAQGALVPATAAAIRAAGTTGSTLPGERTAAPRSAVLGATATARRPSRAKRAARRARQAVRAQGFTG